MAKKAALAADVAAQLREAIAASGLSLSKLAAAAGLGDHSRLSRFVRGERDLTLEAGSRVCKVLGLELCPGPGADAPPAKKKGRRKN
jgi:transcriptional regulator with XRE-family HTH domain